MLVYIVATSKAMHLDDMVSLCALVMIEILPTLMKM